VENVKHFTIIKIYYSLKKMKDRRENRSFLGVGNNGRWEGIRKGGMRVNMVAVFCIHI
jgi:hypothetical protein